jgi:hypothetical protein
MTARYLNSEAGTQLIIPNHENGIASIWLYCQLSELLGRKSKRTAFSVGDVFENKF